LLGSVLAATFGFSSFAQSAEIHEPRPPLKLLVDKTPMNRDASLERLSYAPVVKKAVPSVVNVSSSRMVRTRMDEMFNDPIFRRFFGNPNLGQSRPEKQTSLGSGVIITPDGYILTNNHVVEGAQDVEVSVGDLHKQYKATVVARDPDADVAILKISATGLPAATLGDSDGLEVGDVVFAIGDPFDVGRTVTHGIISAVGRGGLGIEKLENFIQTDAPINLGNSGGPLIDAEGRVIGINTAIISGGGGSNGIGFAIPINLARSRVEQLIHTGRIARGYLGVRLQELNNDLASQFGVTAGALISDVDPNSPADKAGLKSGDVITKINGQSIQDSARVQFIVGEMAPGEVAEIEYVRDQKIGTAQAKLSESPTQTIAEDNETGGQNDTGVLNHVTVSDITPDVRESLHLPDDVQGAVIEDVDQDSASASAGLQQGDVILSLDGRPVHNAEEAVRISGEIKGPKVTVRIWREGASRYVVVDESAS
jgi:serine protease Do